MPIFIAFLSRYWRYVVPLFAIVAVISGIYIKGRNDKANQIQRATIKQEEQVFKSVQRERDTTDRIRKSIRHDRIQRPHDDKRDSCILSNDPFEKNCL